MDLGLQGKRAIVTGASRGIGRAIAGQLVEEGASVAICARGKEGLDEAVAALAKGGGTVHGGAVDVADGEAYADWIRAAIEQLGGLDILVANSSASVGRGEDSWRTSLEVDLLGLVRAVETALPSLQASDAASVVAISTTAAIEAFGDANSYAAIKAAVIAHASGLAQKLGSDGIRVNAVSPGPIEFEGGAWDKIRQGMPDFYDQNRKLHPMGRMGSAEEVARVVAFLASPAASWVTGENVVVDGGFTKRVAF